MARTIASSLADLIYATSNNSNTDPSEVYPFYAVEALFYDGSNATPSRPLRLWTGIGDRTINSETYTGTGSLLTVDGLEEVADLKATNATITLSGLDSTILTHALTEPYQGRTCNIYFGVTNTTSVLPMFTGFMDVMQIEDTPEGSTITMSIESKLVLLERPNVVRHTKAYHQSLTGNSTDTFFNYLVSLQDKEIIWGR